jgi:hypothetical protein
LDVSARFRQEFGAFHATGCRFGAQYERRPAIVRRAWTGHAGGAFVGFFDDARHPAFLDGHDPVLVGVVVYRLLWPEPDRPKGHQFDRLRKIR